MSAAWVIEQYGCTKTSDKRECRESQAFFSENKVDGVSTPEIPLTSPVTWPRRFQALSSVLLLPKAPVVPVTPAPDPHGWRSEHIQSISRTKTRQPS